MDSTAQPTCVTDGDGSALEMDMFAKYPRTPSDSTPNTPYPQPSRKLRCKMCRRELATREHMVDHGQVGPATPATGNALSPAVSRRPSAGENSELSRRGSLSVDHASNSRKISRSAETTRRPSFGVALAGMTPITSETAPASTDSGNSERERRPSTSDAALPRRGSIGSNPFGGLAMTPMSTSAHTSESLPPGRKNSVGSEPIRRSLLGIGDGDANHLSMSALESDDEDGESHNHEVAAAGSSTAEVVAGTTSSPLSSPQELAAQLHPTLAALRTSPLISALRSNSSLGKTTLKDGAKKCSMSINSVSPPLLMPNAKCSGYFVEPVIAFHSTLSISFLLRGHFR